MPHGDAAGLVRDPRANVMPPACLICVSSHLSWELPNLKGGLCPGGSLLRARPHATAPQDMSSSLRSEAELQTPTRPAGTFPRLRGAREEAGPCEQPSGRPRDPDARSGPFLRAGFYQNNQATEFPGAGRP